MIISTFSSPERNGPPSDFQRLQIDYTRFRELHALLDEVVLHAADFRRFERLDPVDAPLADRRLHAAAAAASSLPGLSAPAGICSRQRGWWRGVQIDVLHVHRDEPARVLREVFVGNK